MLPIDGGISPKNRFLEKTIASSLGEKLSSLGMVPEMRFLAKASCTRLWHCDKFFGNSPVKELLLNSRNRSLVKRVICGGIGPWKKLLSRVMLVRRERLPMCGERLPMRPRDDKVMATTLFPRHWMPVQLHKGSVWFHEERASCGS